MDVYQLQSFENELNRFLIDQITLKSMIDVGAHTGTTLKGFLLNGFKVYAFEPYDINRKKIKENFGGCENLKIFSEALSDHVGIGKFHLAENVDGSIHEYYHSLESIPEDGYHKKGPTIDVSITTINELIKQNKVPSKVGFLKVDTEGHDIKVLEGSSELEAEAISVEYWSAKHALGISPSPPQKMIDLLEKRGFANYVIVLHEGANTHFYTKRYDFTDDSWGNIFFFHNSNKELYINCLEYLINSRVFFKLNFDVMQNKIDNLSNVCDERLQLINYLTNEADKRLQIISELKAELEKLRE